jgi:hypothetical protein
VADPVEE